MAIYRIYFFGLILHISKTDNDLKAHSAVLWVNDHDPRLMFGKGDELNLRGIPSIEIGGLDPAPAKDAPAFTKFVPSVREVMGGFLETNARQGTSDDATFFRHVGGTLHAAALYPFKAQHFRGGQEVRNECVASLTLLRLETDKPLTVKAGPITRPFPAGSCLLVANFDRPDPDHDPETDPHIRRYSRLTNLSNTALTIIEDEDKKCPPLTGIEDPCDWVTDEITKTPRGLETSVHSECGNNNWP